MKKVLVFMNKGYVPVFNPNVFNCVNCDLHSDLAYLNCLLLEDGRQCPLYNKCYVTLKELKGGL